MNADLRWPRASAWLAGERLGEARVRLGLLGAPLALASITPGRCDLAPAAVRRALERYSTWDGETGHDLRELALHDFGDAAVAHLRPEAALEPLAGAVRRALEACDALVVLGGDNSVTRPACHAAAPSLERLGLLTLDAHFDLRDPEAGLTNGNPVAALLADGLPGSSIVQVGIQPFANSPAYAEVARKAGITVVPIHEVRARGMDAVMRDALAYLDGRAEVIYADLDLDVLDRAFSPATPGSRPGGVTPAEVLRAARLCGAHAKVRVLDLVEMDPERDIGSVTALTAAASLLHFAAGMLEGRRLRA